MMTEPKAGKLPGKTFPIQGEGCVPPRTVPWFVAEAAYRTYSSKCGTQQSLERLAERHGFGRDELINLLIPELRRLEKENEGLQNTVRIAAIHLVKPASPDTPTASRVLLEEIKKWKGSSRTRKDGDDD